MKFFKPEDFEKQTGTVYTTEEHRAASIANAKLEREGKAFYAKKDSQSIWFGGEPRDGVYWQALLINIEPIEKCTHPSELVRATYVTGPDTGSWVCQCGARVKPTEFEVCE